MEIERIGPHTLYRADCRDVMEEAEADVTITDPPYAERTHAGARTTSGYEVTKLVDFDHISDGSFIGVASMALSVTKRWVVMTCDHRHAALTFDWPEFIRLGAWVKSNPAPQISGDRPGSGHESVLILHGEGRKRWNGGGRAATWRTNTVMASEMPTQKPIELINRFTADFSDEGETVADWFMGSGTTGVACANLGRRFIGVELDRERFDMACKRIEYAESQLRLFA